jgi:uncharacterized protein (DUF2141 family)
VPILPVLKISEIQILLWIKKLFDEFRRSPVLMIFLSLIACAKQSPPPGGPVDETPPKILEVEPSSGSVRVPRDTHVRFLFSEKIDRRSLNDAIFVTPNPGGELRFDWSGPALEIKFPDSLRSNTTYVVTLGTGIRDLRNNRLDQSFSIAFSTGDSIAAGELQGKIYGEKVQGVLVGAYLVGENQELDPARMEADYTTQSGKAGEFEFRHLVNGIYRVFAVDDKYGNRLYDRGEDAIGVASDDFKLSGEVPRASGINLRLAQEDTLKPSLTAVVATDNRHLEWRFEEPVLPNDGNWFSHLRILPSPNGPPAFAVLASTPYPLNPEIIHSFTAPQAAGSYHASAVDLFDRSGLPLDSASRDIEFTASSQIDTLRPRLVRVLPGDSSRTVALDAPVELTFSELMRMDTSHTILMIRDSAGVAVRGRGKWKNHFQFEFEPAAAWQSRAKHVIEIFPDSTFDLAGLALFDTLGQRVFWTVNADTLSSISGNVNDTMATTGPLRMSAKQIVGGKVTYETTVDAPGPYKFDGVLPGVYQLSIYRDANVNGRYDFGKAFPFFPAERFFVSPDSIKVRARWPNEGNDVRLP